MAGYDQGAQILHNAASIVGNNIMSWVAGVVTFGAPNRTTIDGIADGKHMSFCHPEDDICDGKDKIRVSHLQYAADVDAAADFVISVVL